MKEESYIINSDKIDKDYTIINLSDIHLKDYIDNNFLDDIKTTIANNNPDYITLTGDYFKGHTKYSFQNPNSKKAFYYFLDNLKELAPIILSLGNHDVRIKNENHYLLEFKKLEDKNIYPLLNEQITFDDIVFTGYFPPRISYAINRFSQNKKEIIQNNINDTLTTFNNSKLNILLCHLPNIILDKDINLFHNYDITLSGHTHNGMLSTKQEEKLNHLINILINKKFLMNYKEKLEKLRFYGLSESPPFYISHSRGMHKINDTTLIISRNCQDTKDFDNNYLTRVKCISNKKNP